MIAKFLFASIVIIGMITPPAFAQVKNFTPVTQEILLKPSPDDWLMPSRTYDWQRFSPLNQLTKQNVGQLRMAWARGMVDAPYQELIPIVHDGVMYVFSGPAIVQALDATNGDLLWEYRRKLPDNVRIGRARTLAIFDDLVFFAAPDGYLVALDARTGGLRWETQTHDPKTGASFSTGPISIDGKVLTGRICSTSRVSCFIAAHDARTGKELWKFFVTPAPGEPGGDTWGNVSVDKRTASPWGLTGSYDPVRKLTFWGVGNPKPITRMARHGGDPDGVSRSAPADLYSGATVALNIETGKLAWYYQYSPGDDWNSDDTHGRVLFRTAVNPDRNSVKWINPRIPHGQERDVVASVGETGGLFVNDRATGEFIWATPFPHDTPEFHLSKVDVETGKTFLNWDLVAKKAGEKHTMCFQDAIGYWPMAYDPGKNSLYIPYEEMCAEETVTNSEGGTSEKIIPRPGSDPNAFAGIAKVNMATGQIQRFHTQRFPGVGAMLATAGDLIFWGDMNRRLRAFDADSGKVLWETIVGGIVQNSTITYSVSGKQYLAVLTGDGVGHTAERFQMVPEIKSPHGHNAIYVFALP
jgi:alcohol dehydrogenase (cytochrome c)